MKISGTQILQIIGGVAIMSALTGPKPAGPATWAFYMGCLVGGGVLVTAASIAQLLGGSKKSGGDVSQDMSPAARFKKQQLEKARQKKKKAPARKREPVGSGRN